MIQNICIEDISGEGFHCHYKWNFKISYFLTLLGKWNVLMPKHGLSEIGND